MNFFGRQENNQKRFWKLLLPKADLGLKSILFSAKLNYPLEYNFVLYNSKLNSLLKTGVFSNSSSMGAFLFQ